MGTIWLASASPRRRQLLQWVGLVVEVHPPEIDERRIAGHDPVSHALRVAENKALTGPADRLVLAADTVVHLDDQLFEKPVDREQAIAHLRTLSGRWHTVTTGVCVRRGDDSVPFSVTTKVRFRALSTLEIEAYVATGEADDKAGAYGIQGRAGAFVAELRGSWTNVMGLPLERTLKALEQFR